MGKTKIEWTEHSWNPVTGCTKISPGCENCYAERRARMLAGRAGYPETPHHFDVVLRPERLDIPLRRRKPTMYFIPSMGDLFHPDVPFEFIQSVWKTMRDCPQHTFQVLTKRPRRMITDVFFSCHAGQKPLPNVWGGVSVENQDYLWRIEELLNFHYLAVRFMSLEPLLGAVDLEDYLPYDTCAICGWEGHTEPDRCPDCDSECCMGYVPGIDWVIVGGESGPGARPMHPSWVRGVRDQCVAAGVPFFFKQWGAWFPRSQWEHNPYLHLPDDCDCVEGHNLRIIANDTFHRVGKKAAGRLLDGRTWDEMPALQGRD